MGIPTYPLWPAGRAALGDSDEERRGEVIASYGLGRVTQDPELQRIVAYAAELCGAPTAMVSVVEKDRQWFLAQDGIEAAETPRSISFCAHAMLGEDIMTVPDATLDARFRDNPLVTAPAGIRFYAGAPLVSSEGMAIGALCVIDTVPRPEGLNPMQRRGLSVLSRAVLQRLTCERTNQSASMALDEADRRLLRLAEHLPIYAWASDAAGKIDFANSALYDFVGTRNHAELDLAGLVHPDDRQEIVQAQAVRSGDDCWEARARVRSQDGTYRWMMIRAWRIRERDAAATETWFGAAIDIDDLHRLSEHRDLLARELSHRIKNIFTVVSGLVNLRARGREELGDFARELTSVFHALGRAHDYVRPLEGRKGDSLKELLDDLLAPYRDAADDRISIVGEDAAIGARAATPLALVFHELATNSAKYGALSERGGQIDITIRKDGGQVAVDWVEKIARDAKPYESDGFGTRLLKSAIEGQLGGRLDRTITGAELDVSISVPLAALGE